MPTVSARLPVSDLPVTHPGVLPLRPLTTGELLDGSIALMRTQLRRLVGLAVLVAVIEQAALFPLRRLSDQDLTFLPADDRLSEFGWLIVASFATEAAAIAVLGGVAATQGARALLGRAAPQRLPARPGSVAVLAMVTATVAALTAATAPLVLPRWEVFGFVSAGFFTALAWPLPFGLLGMAAAAAVVEQRGPASALARSVRLAGRHGMRAGWIRILGYLSWGIIRIALYAALSALVGIFLNPPSSTIDNVVMAAIAVVTNSLAYPVLACLDVMLLVEARMRSEGLDIALRRDLRRGVASGASLRVAG
jgi:hypothetical protein